MIVTYQILYPLLPCGKILITIPGILSVKCYNGIVCACGILHILFALNTNKHFWCRCWESNRCKDFDTSLISANLVITSFCGITPVLLNCGKDRTTDAVTTFWRVSTKKEETLKNPGCLNIQDPSTLEPCHLIGLHTHIYYSNHV